MVECWARALGVSKERLLTLVREVVTERERDLISAATGYGEHHRSQQGDGEFLRDQAKAR